MFVKALVNSGATGMFIDIKFVRLKNIWTHRLPRAILVYNINGTPNKARHITKVIDLIVQYKDHSEWVTWNVTSIGYPRAYMAHGTQP